MGTVAAAPGFFVLHATHSFTSFLLRTMHAEHSHVSDFGLNASPKVFLRGVLNEGKAGVAVDFLRGVVHATQESAVNLLRTIQASHSHSFEGFLNWAPKSDAPVDLNDVALAEGSLGCVSVTAGNWLVDLSASRTLPFFN